MRRRVRSLNLMQRCDALRRRQQEGPGHIASPPSVQHALLPPSPHPAARLRSMNLKKAWRSAVTSAASYPQFISNCPLASSWSFW